MPQRAFVPAPLTEAQPRVYRSFRGRQLHGILAGVGGALVSIIVFGASEPVGYGLTFLAALPGFAYGYYQPQGKPVEYWLRVLIRFYTAPRRWSVKAPPPLTARLKQALKCRMQAHRYVILRRLARRKRR